MNVSTSPGISKQEVQRRLARADLESLQQVLMASSDRRCREAATDHLATEGELGGIGGERQIGQAVGSLPPCFNTTWWKDHNSHKFP